MALTTVERVGDTLALAFSDGSEQELERVEGSRLQVQRTEQGLEVRPPRYTLDELLAKCDDSLPMSDEEREWLDAPPVGREFV